MDDERWYLVRRGFILLKLMILDPGVELGVGLPDVPDFWGRYYAGLSNICVCAVFWNVKAYFDPLIPYGIMGSENVRPSPAQVVEAEYQNAVEGAFSG